MKRGRGILVITYEFTRLLMTAIKMTRNPDQESQSVADEHRTFSPWLASILVLLRPVRFSSHPNHPWCDVLSCVLVKIPCLY